MAFSLLQMFSNVQSLKIREKNNNLLFSWQQQRQQKTQKNKTKKKPLFERITQMDNQNFNSGLQWPYTLKNSTLNNISPSFSVKEVVTLSS